jgi:hypothetical protein
LGGLPSEEQIWAALGSRYRVDLICEVFVRGVNQGFELSPRVLQLLGWRAINLAVDIFCEPDAKQQEALHERVGTRKSEG